MDQRPGLVTMDSGAGQGWSVKVNNIRILVVFVPDTLFLQVVSCNWKNG